MKIKDKSDAYEQHQPDSQLMLAVDAGTPSSINLDQVEIGKRLKAVRNHFGLTQPAFAAAVGVSKPGLQDNEAGKSMPGGKMIGGLIQLGINANWLLTGDGPMLLKDMTETPPPPIVDAEILQGVIEGVEASLTKHRLVLPPAKKAHLIGVLYDYYRATGIGSAQGQQGGVAVDRFLKLVT